MRFLDKYFFLFICVANICSLVFMHALLDIFATSVFARSASQTVALTVLPNIAPDSTSNVSCATSGSYYFLSNGRSVLCTIQSQRNGVSQKVAWTNFVPAISAGGGMFRGVIIALDQQFKPS